MDPKMYNNEVAHLRQRLRHLEQENDDLQCCVRRLEATEEDLTHKLECAEEEVVFARQDLESVQKKLVVYEDVVSRLMKVAGIPYPTKLEAAHSSDTEEKEYELKPPIGVANAGQDEKDKKDNHPVQGANGDADPASYRARPTSGIGGMSEQKLIDLVETLRTELQVKTEELQATIDDYDDFMAVSYEVEKALASENSNWKHLNAELQAENARLRVRLQTERKSSLTANLT